MTEIIRREGRVFTFYSFKGGVGRTMALANTAVWLASWGKRVLIVDWDLEAPGLYHYFSKWDGAGVAPIRGVMHILSGFRASRDDSSEQTHWRDAVKTIYLPFGTRRSANSQVSVDIICCGEGDAQYFSTYRDLNISDLFERHDLGRKLEIMRAEWMKTYEFILIDSRTGVTDIGGVCTIHMPDVMIAMFTMNSQSLEGVVDVAKRARAGHQSLAADRQRLMVVPVSSRDETENEVELSTKWKEKAAQLFEDCFDDWLPASESRQSAIDVLKIRHVPYWSFGERIPVAEESDPDNQKSMAFAFQPLARLIVSQFNWREVRFGDVAATNAAVRFEEKELAAQARAKAERDRQHRDNWEQRLQLIIEAKRGGDEARVRERAGYTAFLSMKAYASVIALSAGLLSLLQAWITSRHLGGDGLRIEAFIKQVVASEFGVPLLVLAVFGAILLPSALAAQRESNRRRRAMKFYAFQLELKRKELSSLVGVTQSGADLGVLDARLETLLKEYDVVAKEAEKSFLGI